MKFRLNQVLLATLLAAVPLATGCGGLAASPTVSPLMFLIPGMGQAKPRPVPVAPEPPVATGAPILAQAR